MTHIMMTYMYMMPMFGIVHQFYRATAPVFYIRSLVLMFGGDHRSYISSNLYIRIYILQYNNYNLSEYEGPQVIKKGAEVQ